MSEFRKVITAPGEVIGFETVFEENPHLRTGVPSKKGTVERCDYVTDVYENGKTYSKYCYVYLPYGYDPDDREKKYNVLYFQHGNTCGPDIFAIGGNKPMIDMLFESGEIDPVIVVSVTYYFDPMAQAQERLITGNTPAGDGWWDGIKGNYHREVVENIIPYIGEIPLNRLQPKDIQKLYDTLSADGLCGTSIRYVHNNLHRALRHAVKVQVLNKNAADFVEAPKVDTFEAAPLTPEQVKKLLAVCADTEIYLPVLLAVTLGLRRGEALGLLWECVDFTANTVTIKRSASFSGGEIILSVTKTKNSRRTLLMPDMLHDALESALARQVEAAHFLGAAYNPLHLVCCRTDGRPLTSCALHHQFHEVLEAAGLPSIRFHDLRHTNATLMLRNAVPAKIVSSMLGHSSIGITMDTYSHVITEMQEAAINVMDDILKDIC